MIETDRLILRPPRLEDFEPIAAMSADPRVARFVGGRPGTREESWIRLLRFVGHWTLFGYGLFSVIEREGGSFAGYSGLAFFERGIGADFDRDPEAGWAFAPAFQGRGYAGEATGAIHDWFDEHVRRTTGALPPRTVCMIDPENAPSLRLAAALGYRPFGEALYHEKRLATFERRPATLQAGRAAP